jgi:hypothetical protein
MSGVDQLFDRFGNLLKSWMGSEAYNERPFSDPDRGGQDRARSGNATGDPFLDDAMAELDAYLEDDREAQARLEREREARRRAEEQARARRPGYGSSGQGAGPPAKLVAAYKTLGLPFGASFAEVKTAYKRLLKEHHPDKHGSSPESQKNATETSTRINDAYRIIETWRDTGTLGDE